MPTPQAVQNQTRWTSLSNVLVYFCAIFHLFRRKNVQIIIWIIATLVFLIIFYLLGVQFYQLGLKLKEKYSITYRLYLIFWILIGAMVAIGLTIGAQDGLKSYQHNKKQEELSLILELDKTTVWSGQQISNREKLDKFREAADQDNISDNIAYNMILTSKTYSNNIEIAKSKGFTDKDVASAMGLYLSYDYKPPELGTMDDLHQLMQDDPR